MNDETMLYLTISVSAGAFVGFVVHLLINNEDIKPQKKKK